MMTHASVGINLVKYDAGDGNKKNGTRGVFHALDHSSSAGKGEAGGGRAAGMSARGVAAAGGQLLLVFTSCCH